MCIWQKCWRRKGKARFAFSFWAWSNAAQNCNENPWAKSKNSIPEHRHELNCIETTEWNNESDNIFRGEMELFVSTTMCERVWTNETTTKIHLKSRHTFTHTNTQQTAFARISFLVVNNETKTRCSCLTRTHICGWQYIRVVAVVAHIQRTH